MSRKHLFTIVVLLAAAAVAGLLALTRTTPAATPASNTEIATKTRSLDRLEASLRRSLAEKPPALPAASRATLGQPSFPEQDEHGEDEHAEDQHDDDDDASGYEQEYEGEDD